MGPYIIRRLLQAIPTLFLITGIVFVVTYFIPGDPAMVVLGQGATPEALAAMRERLNLTDPLPIRYVTWLGQILQGDLGHSVLFPQSVWALIAHSLPITIYLSILSMMIALMISVPAGIVAALKRGTWIDLFFTTFAFLGVSIPGFWLAIMLVIVFGARLQWVPLEGYIGLREDPVASLKTMILPAFTLGIFLAGPLTRYLRSSMLQTIDMEYVLVARAKGLQERAVISRHILRNSLIPFITVIGVQTGYLLGGAVVIENVFALPGVGDLAVSAIGNRDYPVIQGVVLVIAIGFVLVNLVVDILYSVLDPRIRVH